MQVRSKKEQDLATHSAILFNLTLDILCNIYDSTTKTVRKAVLKVLKLTYKSRKKSKISLFIVSAAVICAL
jgi:hypothetical protein